jgi:AcrR family transcriptional regulator
VTDMHGRPVVSDKEKLRRRDEIMTAAKKVFARNGFHATTIADVAKEANLPFDAVYQYFDSRDALFHALMAAEEYALRTHVAVALAASGARFGYAEAPFRATVRATFEFFETDPSCCSATPTRWTTGSTTASAASTSGSSTTLRPSSSLPRSAAKCWRPRRDWWPTP